MPMLYNPNSLYIASVTGGITELSETPTLRSANLGGTTKAELLAYAAEKGVEGVGSSMNKADIAAAIKAAETEQTNA